VSDTTQATPSTMAHGHSRTSNGVILAIVTASHALSHFLHQAFVVMLPGIRDALGMNPVQIGAIMTVRQIASGLASLPGGVICDRLKNRWGLVMSVCVSAFGLGWLAVSVSHGYWLLIGGMIVQAVATSVWHLPSVATLSQRFAARRGTALAIHGVGGSLGDVVGPMITGLLLAHMAWRGLLSIYAAIAILIGLSGLWLFREEFGATRPDNVSCEREHPLAATKEILTNWNLWRVNIVAAIRGMCYQVYTTFLPLFLADELGFDSKKVGLYLGLLFTIGILASPVAGWASDHLGRKRVLVPTLLIMSALTFALALLAKSPLFLVIIILLGIFFRSDYSLLSAAVLDIVGEGAATTTLGIMSFTRFGVAAAGPLIAGYLYQTGGMKAALFMVGGLYFIAAIVFLTTRIEPITTTS